MQADTGQCIHNDGKLTVHPLKTCERVHLLNQGAASPLTAGNIGGVVIPSNTRNIGVQAERVPAVREVALGSEMTNVL